MNNTGFEITNYQEINDMLREMGSTFQDQAWRSVNTKILNTIVKPKLIANLTIKNPEINEDIKVDTVKEDKSAATIGYGNKHDGWMVKFFEYGTKQRTTRTAHRKPKVYEKGR